MMLDLNQNEQRSYQEKYDKVMKAKVNLDFKKTKKIIMGQFSITDAQANSILKKVFSKQNSDELDKEGFFTTLRYIQCLQNRIDIETCNINTIKLQFPLRVNSKTNLRKSFQPPTPEEMLDKSIIALKNLENLIKEPASQEKLKIQISQEITENQNEKVQKEKEENIELEKKQILIANDTEQKVEKINQNQTYTNIYDTFQNQQYIIQPLPENIPSLTQSLDNRITQFGVIETDQENNQNEQYQFSFNQVLDPQCLKDNLQQQQIHNDNNQDLSSKPKQIQENLPDVIEIADDDEEFNNRDESRDIYVWISGYQSLKDGPFSQSYYAYTVCSEIRTDPIQGTYTKQSVTRRYTDFIMLQQYFTKSKLGDIIPSLPEKEGVIANLKKMVVENAKFISQRQEQLQFFLQYLTKYKEDQIFLSFLSNQKRFDLILKELRYNKVDSQDDETFLPDPDEFSRKQILKEMILGKSLQDFLDYFKGEKEIEAKFQEEYRQVQQHYKNLQNKKQELNKFKQCLIQFYEPIDKLSSSNQLQATTIITEDNLTYVQETQKVFQANYAKNQSLIMNQVKQIEYQLNSLTYSYEQIQKQIYKWFAEKKRLREEKILNKSEIQKNDIEEGRLQFVISKTNETMIKLVNQITQDFKGLFKEFVEQLIQN